MELPDEEEVADVKADVRLVDNKPMVVATAEPGEKPTATAAPPPPPPAAPAASAPAPAASPARVFVQRKATSIFRSPPRNLTPDDVLLMVSRAAGCNWAVGVATGCFNVAWCCLGHSDMRYVCPGQ